MCGHTACTICIKNLIQNNTFECPTCRQSFQVNCIDDFTVNFGMIKMIKGVTILSGAAVGSANTTDKNMCSIHGILIVKRCQKCQVWICEHCLELHRQEFECIVTTTEEGLKNIKETHMKLAQSKINHFKSSLIKLEEEMNNLVEDEQKYTQLLLDGTSVLDAVVACHNSLANANTIQAVNDHIHTSLQRECYMEMWTKKNVPNMSAPKGTVFLRPQYLYTFQKLQNIEEIIHMLKSDKEVYSTLTVSGTKYGGKLYIQNDQVHLDSHRADPIPTDAIPIQYDDIKKLVESSTVTFLEISIDGTTKVKVHIKLHKHNPTLVKIFTLFNSGELGTNLIGLGFQAWGGKYLHSKEIAASSNFPQIPHDSDMKSVAESRHYQKIPDDMNMRRVANIGSVLGSITNINIFQIGILHSKYYFPKEATWNVMGEIVEGWQSFRSFRSLFIERSSIEKVKISNCGCILQEVIKQI
ncbi:unnamed protein product [Meganyctiphanes norvegica]|uniref:RING-type domain-containing protein n=1 Tax=Meganyctiphanes norvegica TaxID=48144 RepID=A0AAV2PKG3_MEGNR